MDRAVHTSCSAAPWRKDNPVLGRLMLELGLLKAKVRALARPLRPQRPPYVGEVLARKAVPVPSPHLARLGTPRGFYSMKVWHTPRPFKPQESMRIFPGHKKKGLQLHKWSEITDLFCGVALHIKNLLITLLWKNAGSQAISGRVFARKLSI